MGNIVIRHYLGDLARQDPWKQSANAAAADRRAEARFHRFVMLAPPNQGALLADDVRRQRRCSRRSPATRANNSAATGPSWKNAWPRPTFEFGIIAGGKGNDKGYNPMLPGDNDGVITRRDGQARRGARFRRACPSLHSFIMDDAKVQEYVLRFLQHGYFVSEQSDADAPVGEDSHEYPLAEQQIPPPAGRVAGIDYGHGADRHRHQRSRADDRQPAGKLHPPRAGARRPAVPPSGGRGGRGAVRRRAADPPGRRREPEIARGPAVRPVAWPRRPACRSSFSTSDSPAARPSRLLLAADMTRKRRKKRMDMLAAQIMLSAYLEAIN